MRFKVFTLVCVVSLLMCVGDVWLMVRRGHVVGGRNDLFSAYVKSQGARYTLRAGAGRLVLGAPPVAAPSKGYYRATPYFEVDPRPLPTVLAMLRNEDVAWELMHYESQKAGDESMTVEWNCGDGHETILRNNRLMEEDKGLLIPGLLEALEDPRRAVAAHRFLVARVGYSYWTLPRRPEGKFSMEFDGMKVDFVPLGERNVGVSGGLVDIYTPRGWHVDPGQFPGICARWHGRLDRVVVAVSYGRAAGVAAVLPGVWVVVWFWRAGVRRRRRRGNLCAVCGYDLRASGERCPECGTGVEGWGKFG